MIVLFHLLHLVKLAKDGQLQVSNVRLEQHLHKDIFGVQIHNLVLHVEIKLNFQILLTLF